MKIQSDHSDTFISGVSNSHNFSIQANAKMFEILSSRIYTFKVAAIVRELSCNAYDSHVEAGIKDKPFTVRLPNAIHPYFEIEDTGVGLSEQQVKEVYVVYGNSTKTSSNDLIGAMGLGAKTPFAYTKTFSITTRKDGVENVFNAYIGKEGSPQVSLLSSREISDDTPNGVKISIPVKDQDINTFYQEASAALSMFETRPKVECDREFRFLLTEEERDEINKGEMVQISKSGWPDIYSSKYLVCMGGVFYPVSQQLIEEFLRSKGITLFFRQNYNQKIILKFEIGELSVSASRESLSFDEGTNYEQTLKDKFADAISKKNQIYHDRFREIDHAAHTFDLIHEISQASGLQESRVRELFCYGPNQKPLTEIRPYGEFRVGRKFKETDWGKTRVDCEWMPKQFSSTCNSGSSVFSPRRLKEGKSKGGNKLTPYNIYKKTYTNIVFVPEDILPKAVNQTLNVYISDNFGKGLVNLNKMLVIMLPKSNVSFPHRIQRLIKYFGFYTGGFRLSVVNFSEMKKYVTNKKKKETEDLKLKLAEDPEFAIKLEKEKKERLKKRTKADQVNTKKFCFYIDNTSKRIISQIRQAERTNINDQTFYCDYRAVGGKNYMVDSLGHNPMKFNDMSLSILAFIQINNYDLDKFQVVFRNKSNQSKIEKLGIPSLEEAMRKDLPSIVSHLNWATSVTAVIRNHFNVRNARNKVKIKSYELGIENSGFNSPLPYFLSDKLVEKVCKLLDINLAQTNFKSSIRKLTNFENEISEFMDDDLVLSASKEYRDNELDGYYTHNQAKYKRYDNLFSPIQTAIKHINHFFATKYPYNRPELFGRWTIRENMKKKEFAENLERQLPPFDVDEYTRGVKQVYAKIAKEVNEIFNTNINESSLDNTVLTSVCSTLIDNRYEISDKQMISKMEEVIDLLLKAKQEEISNAIKTYDRRRNFVINKAERGRSFLRSDSKKVGGSRPFNDQ